jgi:hypothetical protein
MEDRKTNVTPETDRPTLGNFTDADAGAWELD